MTHSLPARTRCIKRIVMCALTFWFSLAVLAGELAPAVSAPAPGAEAEAPQGSLEAVRERLMRRLGARALPGAAGAGELQVPTAAAKSGRSRPRVLPTRPPKQARPGKAATSVVPVRPALQPARAAVAANPAASAVRQ